MTKIVYNNCYGGFGLSEAAVRRYAEIKGFEIYTDPKHRYCYFTHPKERDFTKSFFNERCIERDDPALVQVVEELGDKANSLCSKLVIKDLPAGTKYRLTEYDGNESIVTSYDDWRIA